MKCKLLSLILVGILACSLIACGTEKDTTDTSTVETENDTDASNVVFDQDDITVTVVPDGDTEEVTVNWLDGETTRSITEIIPSTMEFYSATNYTKNEEVTSLYNDYRSYTFEDDYFTPYGDVIFTDYSNNSNGNAVIFNLFTNCATIDEFKAHNDELSASTGYENAFYDMVFAKTDFINSKYRSAFSTDEISYNLYGAFRTIPTIYCDDGSSFEINAMRTIVLPFSEDSEYYENYNGIGDTTFRLRSDGSCYSIGLYSNILFSELSFYDEEDCSVDYDTYIDNVDSQDIYYKACINPLFFSPLEYPDIWTFEDFIK